MKKRKGKVLTPINVDGQLVQSGHFDVGRSHVLPLAGYSSSQTHGDRSKILQKMFGWLTEAADLDLTKEEEWASGAAAVG